MTEVYEKTTVTFKGTFTDSDGAEVTPTSASYTLTDGNKNVMNNIDDVAITPLSKTFTITLEGDDLEIVTPGHTNRCLGVTYVYNSSYGTGLTGYGRYSFSLVEQCEEV